MTQKYAIDCKPVQGIDAAIDLRRNRPDELTAPWHFNSDEVFDCKAVSVGNVCRIMNYRTLQVRGVLDDISVLAHFFLPAVDVSRIGTAVDNIVTVNFDGKPEVTGARMLRANAERHQAVFLRLFNYLESQFLCFFKLFI